MSDWGQNNIERLKIALEARKLRTNTQLAGGQSITDALQWGGEQILGALGGRAERKHEAAEGEKERSTRERLQQTASTDAILREQLERQGRGEEAERGRVHEAGMERERLAQEKALREADIKSRETIAGMGGRATTGRLKAAVDGFTDQYAGAKALQLIREGRLEEKIDTYLERAAKDFELSPAEKLIVRNELIEWFAEEARSVQATASPEGVYGAKTPGGPGLTGGIQKLMGGKELDPTLKGTYKQVLDELEKMGLSGWDAMTVRNMKADISDNIVGSWDFDFLKELTRLIEQYKPKPTGTYGKTPGALTGDVRQLK